MRALDEPEIEQRVRDSLAVVELAGSIDRLPSELSGGMRKRAGIARAIALRPDYILFDEPTTGLDPVTTATMDTLMLRVRRETGATMVVVSHDMRSVFTVADRVAMLGVLARRDPHPGSVPINALVAVPGTPLAGREPVSGLEMARAIAAARIVMPKAFVRLSAGRTAMSDETQALCFLAGANSIFAGERLLTTPNPGRDADDEPLVGDLDDDDPLALADRLRGNDRQRNAAHPQRAGCESLRDPGDGDDQSEDEREAERGLQQAAGRGGLRRRR